MPRIILLFLILISGIAHAQYDIQGIVKDQNGYVVTGAEIIVSKSGLKKSTFSNASGTYIHKDMSSGTYVVQINKDDYIEYQQVIVTDDHVNFDILINDLSDYELGDVVIQIESIKSEIEKKGFAVNVIETEAASYQNLQTNELLNRSVGVKVRQNGGMGSSVDYNLNGLSGNSIKMFIDGIPISTYGSSFDLNSINPAMIERIEVYKGVVPGELADDALGGAINIIMKKNRSNNLSASLSYGSFNTTQANFNATYNSKTSGFYTRASGFYNYSDNDYEVWGKFVRNILPNGRYDYVRAKRFNDAFRSYGGVVELGYNQVKWADNFSVGYTNSDSYNEIQHGAFMSIPYKGRFVEAHADVFNLTYNKANIVDGLDVNFQGIYSKRKTTVNDTVPYNYNWFGELSRDLDGDPILRPQGAQQGEPTIANINREIFSFRSGIAYSLSEQHKFIFNHLFYDIAREEDDEIKSDLQRNFIGTRDLRKNVSALTYEMRLLENRFKSTVFGKYYQQNVQKMDPIAENQNGETVRVEKYFSNKTSTLGYGTAVSYLAMPALVLLTSAEKAVRLPSENEVFGDVGENIVENPGIDAERSNNFNLGFKAGLYKIGEHKFSIGASGFIRDTRDKIVRQTQTNLNDAIQTAPFENLGRTKSIGFDAELSYIFRDNLNVLVNFSKFDTRYNTKYDMNGEVLSLYDVQIPSEPFMTSNANVNYHFEDFVQDNSVLSVFYNLSYVDSFYNIWVPQKVSGIDQFKVPAQLIQDVGVSYAFPNKNLVASLDIKNIFNKQAYDNFAVQKPGRAFYLKLNYTLNNF
ncbi:TonB-dependent receptor [Flavimarina sp. Hel_I_48]|uniref:TonB-dependent receptor n=1 Tax=Flavimarina sp. Hel_I_48 TaxID=1392488 RepID=UPI0004DF75F1|nr:TonB-dependent receptor [Flavimarina sp. Hel_I_48]